MIGNILITRPHPKGTELANDLKIKGYKTLVDPLLAIRFLKFDLPDLNSFTHLVITSPHAIKAVESLIKPADKSRLKIMAVGKRTVEAALKAGFENIDVQVKTSAEMIDELRRCKNLHTKRLYVRGRDVSAEIPVDAESIVYEAVPADSLTGETVQAIRNGEVEAVTFFSRRTADIFMRLADKEGLMTCLKSIKALSISDSVVEYASRFKETYTARTPDMPGMLALIETVVPIENPE